MGEKNRVFFWEDKKKLFWDFLTIFSASMRHIFSNIFIFFSRFRNVFPRIMPILHGLIHLARSGSVYVTMAVTLERYFAIVYPFKDFKLKKALLPIAIFFAILYNIPKVRKTSSFYRGFMGSKLHFTSLAFNYWILPIRTVGTGGQGGSRLPDFSIPFNPVPIGGTDYASHITTHHPPDFQTFLRL